MSSSRTKFRAALWHYQEKRCAWCELGVSYENTTIEHLIPRALGGSDHGDNLVVACVTCNQQRGPRMYFGRGIFRRERFERLCVLALERQQKREAAVADASARRLAS